VSSQYCGVCRAEFYEDDGLFLCDDCGDLLAPSGEQLVDDFNKLARCMQIQIQSTPFDAKISLQLHHHVKELIDIFSRGWPCDGEGSNSVRMQGRSE